MPDGELGSFEGRSGEGTDHETEVVGVGGGGDRAGCDDAGDVRDEDGCDFEEACREAEENSNSCGCNCDEFGEVAIKVEGKEAKDWSSNS